MQRQRLGQPTRTVSTQGGIPLNWGEMPREKDSLPLVEPRVVHYRRL